MFKTILAAFVLGGVALGVWAGSDLWTASSEITIEAMEGQEKAVFYVTGMT